MTPLIYMMCNCCHCKYILRKRSTPDCVRDYNDLMCAARKSLLDRDMVQASEGYLKAHVLAIDPNPSLDLFITTSLVDRTQYDYLIDNPESMIECIKRCYITSDRYRELLDMAKDARNLF